MTTKLAEISSLEGAGDSDPTGIISSLEDKLTETAKFATGRVMECLETTTIGFTELYSNTKSELVDAIEEARQAAENG